MGKSECGTKSNAELEGTNCFLLSEIFPVTKCYDFI